jgi:hypothetical protein
MSVRRSLSIQKLIGNDEKVIDPASREKNAKPERKETPHGISRWRESASAKAKDSIRDNRDSTKKLTDLRNLQEKKAFSQITSTEDGIAIDIRPLSQKVLRSIRDNCDSASNVTETSDLQEEKQFSQI